MSKVTPVPLPLLSKTKKAKQNPKPPAKLSGKVGEAAKAVPRRTPIDSSKQIAKHHLSEEIVVDSSDDEELPARSVVNGETNPKDARTQLKTNGTRPASATDSESSSDSDQGDSDDEIERKQQVTQATASAPIKALSTTATGPDAQRIPPIEELIPPSPNKRHETSALRPAQPFEPPKGYKETSDGSRAKNAKLLDQKGLAGKQIWYISAPASLNLSKIQALSLGQLKGKDPALEQDGAEYALQGESQEISAAIQIMLPGEKDYGAVSSKVLMHYRLQHRVKLPDSTIAKQSYTKTKREQPAGMRTRWRPAGAKFTIGEDSDVEVVANDSLLNQHTVTVEESLRKKRKLTDKDPSERKERKKEKKREKDRAAEIVSRLGEDAASRIGSDKLRDESKGISTSSEAQDLPQEKAKKRKKKKDVDVDMDEQGDVSMTDVPTSTSAAPGAYKVNNANLVLPSDLIHPLSEVRKEKKKRREKDKTSARELMDLTNI